MDVIELPLGQIIPYPRQNFMHIDTGRARLWGDPFPPRTIRNGRNSQWAQLKVC